MGEPLSIGIALSDVVIRRRSEPQPQTTAAETTSNKRDVHFMPASLRQAAKEFVQTSPPSPHATWA
jgi:hypothetical protein